MMAQAVVAEEWWPVARWVAEDYLRMALHRRGRAGVYVDTPIRFQLSSGRWAWAVTAYGT